MPISSLDYEKVDVALLQILQIIKNTEQMIASSGTTQVPGTADFIAALDDYRNEIAMEIERQGKR
jgi:hypothetical protein